jgi:hypothetical protein
MALTCACLWVVQDFRDLVQRWRHEDWHLSDEQRELASTSAMRVTREREEISFPSNLGERLEVRMTTARSLNVLQLHNHLQSIVPILDIKKRELRTSSPDGLHFAYLAYQRPAPCLRGRQLRTDYHPCVITRLIIDQLAVLVLEDVYWRALRLSVGCNARKPVITQFVRI